jgi:hypothetical protein
MDFTEKGVLRSKEKGKIEGKFGNPKSSDSVE